MNGNINKIAKGAKKILRSHPNMKYSIKAESSFDNMPGNFVRNIKLCKNGKIDLLKVFCILLIVMATMMLCRRIRRKIRNIFSK